MEQLLLTNSSDSYIYFIIRACFFISQVRDALHLNYGIDEKGLRLWFKNRRLTPKRPQRAAAWKEKASPYIINHVRQRRKADRTGFSCKDVKIAAAQAANDSTSWPPMNYASGTLDGLLNSVDYRYTAPNLYQQTAFHKEQGYSASPGNMALHRRAESLPTKPCGGPPIRLSAPTTRYQECDEAAALTMGRGQLMSYPSSAVRSQSYFPLCLQGSQMLHNPASQMPIMILGGSNPFQQNMGCTQQRPQGDHGTDIPSNHLNSAPWPEAPLMSLGSQQGEVAQVGANGRPYSTTLSHI